MEVVELSETQRDAVDVAAKVKFDLVVFATTPPFERHLRRLMRQCRTVDHEASDIDVIAIDKLLFEFTYDDGTTVIDRFVRRPGLTEDEQMMARGFLSGVESIFEVLADTPAGATTFVVRCCLSDLDHVVVPTEPAGVPSLPRGSFLAGRLNPVWGTDLWTPSGALELLPATRRKAVADAARQLALHAPYLTHRNPDKRDQAAAHVLATHKRFVARHSSDVVAVAGKDLAEVYADALASDEALAPEAVARARGLARQTIEESVLVEADCVCVFSHPVAGFGFYPGFREVARCLERGREADAEAVEVLRGYLEDRGVPSWVLRRFVVDRLPTSEAALALALGRPDFVWQRDGERLLASLPGDQEPTLTLAIVPSISSL